MNKPLYEIGSRIPNTEAVVIDVYLPHGHKDLVYKLAIGNNLLTLLGSQLVKLFPPDELG